MLNYDNLRISENGISDLFWPVEIEKQIEIRNRIYLDLVNFVKNIGIDIDNNAESFWINLTPITTELMELYSALEIKKYYKDTNKSAFSNDSHLFLPVLNGELPGIPRHLQLLRKGLPDVSVMYSLKNVVRKIKQPKPFNRIPMWGYKDKIITISVSPLITKRTKNIEENVYLSDFYEWIPAGGINPEKVSSYKCNIFVSDVLERINKIFTDYEINLSKNVINYLESIITERVNYTRYYLDQIYLKKKYYPREYWLGTGGNYWNKIMARAISNNGGKCIGHDHGTGSGWWDSPVQTFIEFDYIDQFYTFSEYQRDGLRNSTEKKYLVNSNRCQILAVERKNSICNKNIETKRNNKIKKIMYVSTVYTGESCYLIPLHSDMIAIDWQLRLFSFLLNKGFELLFKAHPESKLLPPEFLLNDLNVQLVNNNFNDAIKDVDLLLYDYPQSSTLISALMTDIPILIFDFPRLKINSDAYSQLSKRVVMQRSWYDESNRAQTDWQALETSIASSCNSIDKSNKEFINNYFDL